MSFTRLAFRPTAREWLRAGTQYRATPGKAARPETGRALGGWPGVGVRARGTRGSIRNAVRRGTHLDANSTASGKHLKAVLITGDTSAAVKELQRDERLRLASKPIHAEELLGLLESLLAM